MARDASGSPAVTEPLARRLVEVVAKELALHRALLAVLRDPLGAVAGSSRLADAIRRAAGERRAILSAMTGGTAEASLKRTLATLPPEEAARLDSLRRELGEVMAALGAEGAFLSRVA